MLYVDEDNVPAIRMYEGLGFTRATVDAMYRRGRLTTGADYRALVTVDAQRLVGCRGRSGAGPWAATALSTSA